MPKIDKLAFLAMALHACGFMVAYELMQARQVPGSGLPTVAGAHLACVVLATLALPALAGLGGIGRGVVCLVFLSAFATRLPGVEAWRDSIPIRSVMQMGQGALAAASYWVFFSLTPREGWVRRYILAWLAGTGGKEIILAVAAGPAGERMVPTLYIGAGVVFGLLVAAVSACVVVGDFSRPGTCSGTERPGRRGFAILAANTVLVAAFLGLLSGWVGPFHTLWADASAFAPRIAAPCALLLVGWRLSRDFNAGFREMTTLCAVLCVAIATLSVLRREDMPARSIPLLAVSCQTIFYVCMTLALVRMTDGPRLLGMAAALPYAAMIFAGAVTYRAIPLRELDFSVVLLLCLAVFTAFYFCTGKIDLSLSPASFGRGNGDASRERASPERIADSFGFSPREREAAALLARGMSNADIAAAMHLSRHTINSHVRNMCAKAGVSGREELVGLFGANAGATLSE